MTIQTVVHTGPYPVGVAVDSANDHLYWIDHIINTLSRCNLDGTNITVLPTLIKPWVIRLDVLKRYSKELRLTIFCQRNYIFVSSDRSYWKKQWHNVVVTIYASSYTILFHAMWSNRTLPLRYVLISFSNMASSYI